MSITSITLHIPRHSFDRVQEDEVVGLLEAFRDIATLRPPTMRERLVFVDIGTPRSEGDPDPMEVIIRSPLSRLFANILGHEKVTRWDPLPTFGSLSCRLIEVLEAHQDRESFSHKEQAKFAAYLGEVSHFLSYARPWQLVEPPLLSRLESCNQKVVAILERSIPFKS